MGAWLQDPLQTERRRSEINISLVVRGLGTGDRTERRIIPQSLDIEPERSGGIVGLYAGKPRRITWADKTGMRDVEGRLCASMGKEERRDLLTRTVICECPA